LDQTAVMAPASGRLIEFPLGRLWTQDFD